jgi:hypothetical protein
MYTSVHKHIDIHIPILEIMNFPQYANSNPSYRMFMVLCFCFALFHLLNLLIYLKESQVCIVYTAVCSSLKSDETLPQHSLGGWPLFGQNFFTYSCLIQPLKNGPGSIVINLERSSSLLSQPPRTWVRTSPQIYHHIQEGEIPEENRNGGEWITGKQNLHTTLTYNLQWSGLHKTSEIACRIFFVCLHVRGEGPHS